MQSISVVEMRGRGLLRFACIPATCRRRKLHYLVFQRFSFFLLCWKTSIVSLRLLFPKSASSSMQVAVISSSKSVEQVYLKDFISATASPLPRKDLTLFKYFSLCLCGVPLGPLFLKRSRLQIIHRMICLTPRPSRVLVAASSTTSSTNTFLDYSLVDINCFAAAPLPRKVFRLCGGPFGFY